jgi:hypothetical protein
MTPPALTRAVQPSAVVQLAATQRRIAEPLTILLSAPARLALRGNPGQIEEGLAGGRRTQDQASQLVAEGLEGVRPPYQPQATFANQAHAARTPNAMWAPTDEGTPDLSALAREFFSKLK